jgi:hypothetical protein
MTNYDNKKEYRSESKETPWGKFLRSLLGFGFKVLPWLRSDLARQFKFFQKKLFGWSPLKVEPLFNGVLRSNLGSQKNKTQ